jgi:hypothetical protein
MDRFRTITVLLMVAAMPAAAPSYLATPTACFVVGPVTYRLAPAAVAPHYRVRIDNENAAPTLRVRLVEHVGNADFALVDDPDANHADCRNAAIHKTIRIVRSGPADITVAFADASHDDAPALFVHSTRFGQADAAALFAVMRLEQAAAALNRR